MTKNHKAVYFLKQARNLPDIKLLQRIFALSRIKKF